MIEIEIYSDGACNNKEDRPDMGLGIAVFIEGGYQEELSRAIHVSSTIRKEKLTSNVAEWFACIEAMRIASFLKEPNNTIRFFSDSEIIVNQFNGLYYINKPEFRELNTLAHKFAEKASIASITWIPREKNKKADELSKIGLKHKDLQLQSNVCKV